MQKKDSRVKEVERRVMNFPLSIFHHAMRGRLQIPSILVAGILVLSTMLPSVLSANAQSTELVLATGVSYFGTSDLSNTLRLWRQAGDRTYENFWINTERYNYYSISIGDVDNDKSREVVALRRATQRVKGRTVSLGYTIEIYEQGSTGSPSRTFRQDMVPREKEEAWMAETAIADVDGDSNNELVLKTVCRIFIYDVPTDDPPTEPVILPPGGREWPDDFHGVGLAVGDVNPDKLGEEIVVSTWEEDYLHLYIVVWEHDGDGWSPVESRHGLVTSLGHLSIGNIDGTGVNEIVGEGSSDPYFYVWRLIGSEYTLAYTVPVAFNGAEFVWGISSGDLDTDGAEEVVVAARYRIQSGRRPTAVTYGTRLITYDYVDGEWRALLNHVDLLKILVNQVAVGDTDGNGSNEVIASGVASQKLFIEVFDSGLSPVWRADGTGGEVWYISLSEG